MTENKGDLISRSALKKQFSNECLHNCYYCKLAKWDKEGSCYNCGLIDNAPTVERPQGEWIHKEFDPFLKEYGQCSNCLQRERVGNFCRNCGADMRPKPNQLRDCENCVHHSDNGCEVWECEFEKRSDV